MNIMLDLETMGLSSNAAIIAVGAVAFDKNGVLSRFYAKNNLQSAIDSGGIVDGSTIAFWLGQSDDARKEFIDNEKEDNLIASLTSFKHWYEKVEGEDIWGHGAACDNVWLKNAYLNNNLAVPWKHYNDKCYRTMLDLGKDIEFERIGVYHNALDDAESQALHLIKIWKELEYLGSSNAKN